MSLEIMLCSKTTDTSTGEQFVPTNIIRPVVCVSALT